MGQNLAHRPKRLSFPIAASYKNKMASGLPFHNKGESGFFVIVPGTDKSGDLGGFLEFFAEVSSHFSRSSRPVVSALEAIS